MVHKSKRYNRRNRYLKYTCKKHYELDKLMITTIYVLTHSSNVEEVIK